MSGYKVDCNENFAYSSFLTYKEKCIGSVHLREEEIFWTDNLIKEANTAERR